MSGHPRAPGPENQRHQPGGPKDQDETGGAPIPKAGGFLTKDQPGHQERPMTRDEEMDVSIDETFPASDPASPSRVEGVVPEDKG